MLWPEAYDPSHQRVRERGIRYKKENQWFLPYFTVVREDRTTTKVRIVFAAAARRHINNPSIRFDEGLYARNVSFVISLRWIFHPYQLVWYHILECTVIHRYAWVLVAIDHYDIILIHYGLHDILKWLYLRCVPPSCSLTYVYNELVRLSAFQNIFLRVKYII